MIAVLLIIIVIILLIFLSGKIIQAFAEGAGTLVVFFAYIAKGFLWLIRKIIPRRKAKVVTVFCPCSHSFRATPSKKNNWIVQCPKCGKNLRVDTSKKKAVKEKK
jgi:Zn finger protein HypA/HybF involved in hydrogenase expression